MLDQGNSQLSAVGFFNPMMGGEGPVGAFGGAGVGGLGGVFDIEDGKIVRCAIVFGRQWVKCDDTELPILGEDKAPEGVIYAEIDHSSSYYSSASLKLSVKYDGSGILPDNSLEKSYRALYYAYNSGTNDEPMMTWADVRFQPAMFAMN